MPEPTAAAPPRFRPKARPNLVQRVLKPLASLQLTVALFAVSMVLVFFGTMAQVNNGIWTVVDQYFWSWHVWIPFDLVHKFCQVFFGWAYYPATGTLPGSFPFPAGKLVGAAMLVNLLAAHATRFRFTWKRSGVMVLHAGLILLFVGEAVTRMYQVEQRMVIPEGASVNFAEDSRKYELAVTDTSDPTADTTTVIPHTLLAKGKTISDPALPVDLEILDYMPNSDLVRGAAGSPATAGLGLEFTAVSKPEVTGVDPNQRIDIPTVLVRLTEKGTGRVVGTHLLSIFQPLMKMPPDDAIINGKPYTLALRNTRYYKPFTLKLLEFRFDRFVGTSKAKNYSSDVQLTDPERGVDRTHHIKMNDPLAYRGETFYQSSFEADEKTTILQVVRNPGEQIPYISCIMVTGGMVLHFGLMLIAFLNKHLLGGGGAVVPAAVVAAKTPAVAIAPAGGFWWVPAAVLALGSGFLLYAAANTTPRAGEYDLTTFGRIPVVDGGRLKPLDTVARVSLRAVSARETFKDADGVEQPAIKWLLEVAAAGLPERNGPAMKYKVFKIENDKVLDILGLKPRSGFLYGLDEFADKMELLNTKANEAFKRKEAERDLVDRKFLELGERVKVYIEIATVQTPLTVPTDASRQNWQSYADALSGFNDAAVRGVQADSRFPADGNMENLSKEQQTALLDAYRAGMNARLTASPAASLWNGLLKAYRAKDAAEFNKLLADAAGKFPNMYGPDAGKVARETTFNGFAPFWQCLTLYGVALALALVQFVLVGVGAYGAATATRRATFGLLALTAVVHFAGLIARMYFQDRWFVFVTNLYSSAVFIGLGCVVIGLALELVYPIGVGNVVAGGCGFVGSIIAHNLGASGDTLEMMQAVLDTNFWLATHVTCVTFGYTATFVVGGVGVCYLLLGVIAEGLRLAGVAGGFMRADVNKIFGNMMYAMVAFAALLSFLGTVLGGIWADYSWGRFWGWDPKENGAVLIVIWNALILHARWAGLVKARGIAVLAVLGNMVTVWSWFGTNQLGIGLHAYGFDNTLAARCGQAWLLHLAVACAGVLPLGVWARAGKPAVASTIVAAGGGRR